MDERADLETLRARLAQLDAERAALSADIERLELRTKAAAHALIVDGPAVDQTSPREAKIALFRSLFRGRTDVFPVRWENSKSGRSGYAPACANDWKPGLCRKPAVKCTACPNQAFLPVTDDVVARHLTGYDGRGGTFVAGVYPMVADDHCWFLAADFDDGDWRRDVRAFADVCRDFGLPVAVERSRSGKGAHAWLFFEEAIPAISARRLGTFLITQTLDRTPDLGFKSYDRLFPSQDRLSDGGLGNLIALPLQGEARRAGNSVFVDGDLTPFSDQWSYLSRQQRIAPSMVDALVGEASRTGRIFEPAVALHQERDSASWRTKRARATQRRRTGRGSGAARRARDRGDRAVSRRRLRRPPSGHPVPGHAKSLGGARSHNMPGGFACFSSRCRLPKVRRLLLAMPNSHLGWRAASKALTAVSFGGTDRPFLASAQRWPWTCRSSVRISTEQPASWARRIKLSFTSRSFIR